jgi:hypothetical protein
VPVLVMLYCCAATGVVVGVVLLLLVFSAMAISMLALLLFC